MARFLVEELGRVDYEPTWRAMQRYTEERDAQSPDRCWVLEHPPVFTLGLAGKREHLLAPGDIPVVPVDRGGQVTYHGPGQVVIYPLVDLRRRGLGVRRMVSCLEEAIVRLLAEYDIAAAARPEAPGVYVGERKIASLGLRVRRGASYHGLSLNVAMDLEPFSRINPCGYPGLDVVDMRSLGVEAEPAKAGTRLAELLVETVEAHTRRAPPSR
ncbi:lipoyl(octanoyl) transferase LipB [Alkalilimnicola sp. S0819]|uniref:lipoyl(octanoyl) transferase LipB n=1 Tax=Alkalilimnicola sp. S0819 TaxID=2613922 RepID=UPI00186A7E5D|nr:lipoyl(octanoyl) transferase LipB [Alkalilimnicola sp. S0819]